MERSLASKPLVWEEWATTLAQDLLEPEHRPGVPGPHRPEEFAARLYACEALKPSPAADEPPEPYSLQWFLQIENYRHGKYGRWIPRLLEFVKHQIGRASCRERV